MQSSERQFLHDHHAQTAIAGAVAQNQADRARFPQCGRQAETHHLLGLGAVPTRNLCCDTRTERGDGVCRVIIQDDLQAWAAEAGAGDCYVPITGVSGSELNRIGADLINCRGIGISGWRSDPDKACARVKPIHSENVRPWAMPDARRIGVIALIGRPRYPSAELEMGTDLVEIIIWVKPDMDCP